MAVTGVADPLAAAPTSRWERCGSAEPPAGVFAEHRRFDGNRAAVRQATAVHARLACWPGSEHRVAPTVAEPFKLLIHAGTVVADGPPPAARLAGLRRRALRDPGRRWAGRAG